MNIEHHQPRNYRHHIQAGSLVSFNVTVKETDLFIRADRPLTTIARDLILRHRGYLEAYITQHPDFVAAMAPWTADGPMPRIVRDMIRAGRQAGVGPMAAVAGAMSQRVGGDLLAHTGQVIVENGGDVFINTHQPVTVGVFAGKSPLSMQLGLKISAARMPLAVCTSSGTVGHSVSFGRADAVCVVAGDCALADAAATAIGNHVRSPGDIQRGVAFGKTIPGVAGVLVVVGAHMGAWGELELVPLHGKKGLSFQHGKSK